MMLSRELKYTEEGAGRPAAEERKEVCVFSEQCSFQRSADLQLGPAVSLSLLVE